MKNSTQDSLREMLDMLKGNYSFPVKLWIWAKVIKEWTGIIIGSIILFLIALSILFSVINARNAKQAVVDALPLQEIVRFLAATQNSITGRQEVLEGLMETLELYKNKKLGKGMLETKISTLSSICRTCSLKRGSSINKFTKNPFHDQSVLDAFEKLIKDPKDFFKETNKVLDPRREHEAWGSLCALCEHELEKANEELVQLLKEEGELKK